MLEELGKSEPTISITPQDLSKTEGEPAPTITPKEFGELQKRAKIDAKAERAYQKMPDEERRRKSFIFETHLDKLVIEDKCRVVNQIFGTFKDRVYAQYDPSLKEKMSGGRSPGIMPVRPDTHRDFLQDAQTEVMEAYMTGIITREDVERIIDKLTAEHERVSREWVTSCYEVHQGDEGTEFRPIYPKNMHEVEPLVMQAVNRLIDPDPHYFGQLDESYVRDSYDDAYRRTHGFVADAPSIWDSYEEDLNRFIMELQKQNDQNGPPLKRW